MHDIYDLTYNAYSGLLTPLSVKNMLKAAHRQMENMQTV